MFSKLNYIFKVVKQYNLDSLGLANKYLLSYQMFSLIMNHINLHLNVAEI